MSERTPGLLLVQADVDAERKLEWNRWYNGKHVPDLLGLPGFVGGRRYHAVNADAGVGVLGALPKYLAIYDLDSVDALATEEYRALTQPPTRAAEDTAMYRLFRNANRAVLEQIGEWSSGAAPPGAPALLAVGLVPEPANEDEFNAWYDTEHIPGLMGVPGVRRARRFRATEGEPRYLALYDLDAPEVRDSEAFEAAIDTPWSARMRRLCARRLTGVFASVTAS